MGGSRPRGRRAPDDDSSARTAPKGDRAGHAGSAERQIVDALLEFGRGLRSIPMGPSDSFRGDLRQRLTAAGKPQSDRPRPPRR